MTHAQSIEPTPSAAGRTPWRDPIVRPAIRLTLGLWTFGYVMLAVLMAVQDRIRGPVTVALLLFQYATALVFAAALLLVVLRATGRFLRPLAIAATFVAVVLLQGTSEFTSGWAAGGSAIPRQDDSVPLTVIGYVRSTFPFVWVYGVNLVLMLLTVANGRVRQQERQLAEARTAAAQAQLAMLRYQLNPHFLFNTLNAISTLVVTNRPAEAEEMLTRLSDFLRASLATDPGDFVRLDEELGMIEEYLDIETVRFGERLAVDFLCAPEAGTMLVPSLILQPLVENAIKYAVGPSHRTVTITIDASIAEGDLVVSVEDDGGGRDVDAPGGTGVGLRNVRGRLATLYGPRGTLAAGPGDHGFRAVVRLPATPDAA